MNTQIISKQHLLNDGIFVHHVFATIQGEGPYVGVPAVFLRLWGCNLQCPQCDTDYTSNQVFMTPQDVLMAVELHKSQARSCARLIVFSGGEPLRQNIVPTIQLLLDNDYFVQIETNGTLYVPDIPEEVIIVCSPKAGKINAELLPRIDAFKYVLKNGEVNPDDGLPLRALDHPAHPFVARPPKDFPVFQTYLQPLDEGDPELNKIHTQAVIASCLRYGYTLCLQTHKLAGLE